MKIVAEKPCLAEAFLFSEEYERELLFLKFFLGNGYIDEWIVCENAYSHQGDFKGHVARKIVETDDRFKPFLNKITFLEGSKQFDVIDKTKREDNRAFICENWQRGQAYDYFLNKYNDNDWLILHDVDETIDFTDTKRKEEFFARLEEAKNSGFLNVPRRRYWYDFDNEYGILYGSPLCTKWYIKANAPKTLSRLRDDIAATPLNGWQNIIAFEYSSCFDADYILRKLQTTAHTGYTEEQLKQSLRCNHRIVSKTFNEQLRPTPKFYFNTVTLNEQNSPLYVRQNLQQLKTNNIDANYVENRKQEYPEFHLLIPSALTQLKFFAQDKFKWFKRKYRNVRFRFKLIYKG